MRSVALTRQAFPFALALLAGALLAPAPARGVALGNIASQSSLGQPLRIEIPVVLNGGETLNTACLKLVADNTQGAPPQIVTGRVSLERAATSPRLVVATATPVNEPAVRLAVQTGCGSTTRRDYVLLLDPPSAESPMMVASADTEEPAWIAQQSASTPAPRSTRGTPVATAPRAPEAGPPLPIQESRPPIQVAEMTAPPQRELVTLVGGTGSGGFIPEAAAAALPMPMRALASPTMSAKSLPLISPLGSRPQPQAPAMAVWRQMWPYVAAVLSAIMLALVAFILHRRSPTPAWLAPSARSALRADTQAGASQLAFAQFGEMTEPNPIAPRATRENQDRTAQKTVTVTGPDTLLLDLQNDVIDEHTIRDAWKAAATDAGVDMGGDSILKAIAAAERDLQIGEPEPMQTAMDTALDNELLTVPNFQAKPQRR